MTPDHCIRERKPNLEVEHGVGGDAVLEDLKRSRQSGQIDIERTDSFLAKNIDCFIVDGLGSFEESN